MLHIPTLLSGCIMGDSGSSLILINCVYRYRYSTLYAVDNLMTSPWCLCPFIWHLKCYKSICSIHKVSNVPCRFCWLKPNPAFFLEYLYEHFVFSCVENNDTVSNIVGIHTVCFECFLVLPSLIWKQHGWSGSVITCVPFCIVTLCTTSILLLMEKNCCILLHVHASINI